MRCPFLFNEVLHTLWDHRCVFIYGSIRALADARTLVHEQLGLIYPDIPPDRNRDRRFAEFAARV